MTELMKLRLEEWVGMICTLVVCLELVAHSGATVHLWVEERLRKWRVRREINKFVKHFGKRRI